MQLLTQSTDNKTDFVDINILVISKSMPEEVIVTLVVSVIYAFVSSHQCIDR